MYTTSSAKVALPNGNTPQQMGSLTVQQALL